MIKYYTKAWTDECMRRINSDPTFEQEGKKLNGVFAFRVYDRPDGKDRSVDWNFQQGKLIEIKYQAEQAPWNDLRNSPFNSAWMSRCTAPYSMMMSLNKGETSPMRALASPQYKIEGNKMTLMQLMKPLGLWNQICASVEAGYEYASEEAAAEAPAADPQAAGTQEG